MGTSNNEERPDVRPAGESPVATDSKPIVERARDILIRPREEWPRIEAEPATIGGIYKSYVMILAAVPPGAYAIGALVFGFSALGFTYRPPVGGVIVYAVVLYLLALASVYVLALIIDALAPNFGGTKNQVKAFKVAAYSGTAGWVAGIFSIIPSLSWLSILGLYGLYLLYLGLPKLMRAPDDKALGYTIVTIIAAVILSIVVGSIAGLFVAGAAMTPGLG